MSASDSIIAGGGGCDEASVDSIEVDGSGGGGVRYYFPPANACGQGGMDYMDMGCEGGGEEAMYDCPVDANMRMTAGPVGSTLVDGSIAPMPLLYCRPNEPGGVDEGVEG